MKIAINGLARDFDQQQPAARFLKTEGNGRTDLQDPEEDALAPRVDLLTAARRWRIS